MRIAIAILAASLTACSASGDAISDPAVPAEEIAGWAHLDETINVGPFIITPREITDDSRCPSDVQCVWAGELRLNAEVSRQGDAAQLREFILSAGLPKIEAEWDGAQQLKLVKAEPYPATNVRLSLQSYRFRFVFED